MNQKSLWVLVLALWTLGGCGGSATEAPSTKAEAHHEHGEPGHVELTPEQIQAAGIVVAEAGPATIRETLPVYGVIAPNAERVRDVAARFPGVILAVTAKVGDAVRAGETLATVESNESLQSYAVVAPLNGVVTARQANPGEQTGEKVLFTIADLSSVWVELSLFPRDMTKVRVGQTVQVASNDTGLRADGKIIYVAPFGSSANQTLTARVLLDNADRRWAPGLYVSARVTLGENPVPLVVRNEALQTLDNSNVVFVHARQGFEPRPVRIGRADGQLSEVTEGLRAGERYAAANSFILKAELGKGSAEHDD
ncbi:efflux RND transporter periplasmic adaptor subunit [Peristeroidobacter agariperforans]|uniref:efflux RND transporter periplasmic adaptor subunit n=1 Tax=Peristeroidobacter agariperforans TaxID=268404 RepID=UPI00101C5FD4|nr:efflux RND transporter periplasmic adaptor subunit [Peristeroidobacter agariperforans]